MATFIDETIVDLISKALEKARITALDKEVEKATL